MVRLAAYGGVSCLLAGYVVLSAFRQRSNFFSAAVYLSKSNACMMILWNFGVFLTVLFGRGLQTLFFGPLRLLEVERLHERAWYAVTESLLALTIFRDEFDTSFVILFISLLFLKIFHWLAGDRVEMMEQSPTIPRIFHFRMVTVLATLWVVDSLLIVFAADAILTEGASVMIMFASEYMIMLATLLGTTMKYGVNVYDLRSDIPWENKSVFVFYIDLACDFLKLSTYLCFFSLILTFYGLPLNILRDVYVTARSFVLKVRDLARYRQATRNMDERYPNATAEELESMSDKTCIICREEMEARNSDQAQQPPAQARGGRSGPNDTPKRLPCGHVFHFHCLRSWLERQQSCPTCRRPVLSTATNNPATQPAPAQAQGGHLEVPPAPQRGQAPRPPGGVGGPTPTVIHQPHTRPSSRSGEASHRSRRAGMDNPLVAFQTPNSQVQPTPTRLESHSTASEDPQGPKDDQRAQNLVPASAMPSLAVQSPSTQSPAESTRAPTEMDERAQLRQRLEAAARLRQAAKTAATPTSTFPSSGSADTPTPKVTSVSSEDDAVDYKAHPVPPAIHINGIIPENELQNTAASVPLPPSPGLSSHRNGLEQIINDPSSITYLAGIGQPPPSSAPNPSPTATSSIKNAIPPVSSHGYPRLIPLFHPGDPSKPSPLVHLIPKLYGSPLLPHPLASLPIQTQPEFGAAKSLQTPKLPAGLTQDQLSTIAQITKEGLEARLSLLANTQETLQACVKQIQDALQLFPVEDVQAASDVAVRLNERSKRDTELTDIEGRQEKGKSNATDQTSL